MADNQANDGFVRVLGNRDVLVLAFGAMIGWSWVLLTGTWITTAGSLGTLIAFLAGGTVIGFIGLTYAELAAAMPHVGGEHVYTERALGKTWSFVCTWSLLFAYVAVCAFEAIALPTAFVYLMPEIKMGALWSVLDAEVDLGFVIVGVVGTLVITIVNVLGIRMAALFQKFTVLLIFVAGILIITGALSFGSIEHARPWIAEPASGILVLMIMVPGFLLGFDVIPQSADEINLPYKQIGKVLVLSLLMAIAWYALMSIGVAVSMPLDDLAASEMATGDAASRLWSNMGGTGAWAGQLVVLGGIGGILTSWNAFVVGGSRVLYALAKSSQVPRIFMSLHPKYKTPWVGIVFIGLLAILAPFAGRTIMIWIVNVSSFAAVLAFVFVAITYVVLRRREPEMERPYRIKYPRFVGYGAVILSLGLLSIYMPWSPSGLVWPYEWGMILLWAIPGIFFWWRSRRLG